MWAGLAEEVKSVLNDYPTLCLTQGRKVYKIILVIIVYFLIQYIYYQ